MPKTVKHQVELPAVLLGRTGLNVFPIGLGGGRGISSADVTYAARRGINYFFWSSDLHHHLYREQVSALRRLFRQGSQDRDRRVLAVASYVDHPEKLFGVLRDQLLELGVDHVDIFFWGWMTSRPTAAHFHGAEILRDPRTVERMRSSVSSFRTTIAPETAQALPALPNAAERRAVADVATEIKSRGYARYIGASFHDRELAMAWLDTGLLDVMMLRYNPRHRNLANNPLASSLNEPGRPGVVAFNTAYGLTNILPSVAPSLQVTDLYRFALRLPFVDMVLAGLTSRQEIDQAIGAALAPPLSEDEHNYLINKLGNGSAEERR